MGNLKHSGLAAFLTVCLTAGALANAQKPETNPQYEKDRTSCISTLRIPERLLETTSFALRLHQCIQSLAAERDRANRVNRVVSRIERIQESLPRNSRAYLWRKYTLQREAAKLLNGDDIVVSPKELPPQQSPPQVIRPSRRLLQQQVKDREANESSNLLRNERMRTARQACSYIIDNPHEYQDCVRKLYRKLGE